MIKKFLRTNYKKPLFWIIPAVVLVCAAAAVIAVINPFEKVKSEPKKDMSSQEVTVKEDGASKDDTASGKDTEKEKEETGTKPVVSEEPVTSSEPEESDEYINERDNFGTLDIKIVKDIKDTLDLSFGEYGVEDIYIKKYYGTYSDGSVVISVGFLDKRGEAYYYPAVDVAVLYPAVYEVSGYVVNHKFYPYVYYKGRVERLDTAFQEGLISAKSIDELFNNNPDVIIYNDEIYNEKDNYGNLDKANVYNIKNQYLMYLLNSFQESGIKTELKLSDIFIEKYYGQMYNGTVIVSLSYNEGSDRETIVEKVSGYDYIHKEDQGIFVYNSCNGSPGYVYGVSALEELDIFTNSDLKNIFAKFPEFLKK